MTLLVTLKSHLVHRWVDDWIDCFRRGENGPPFIDYCTGGLLINYLLRKAEKEPIKSLDWGMSHGETGHGT